MKILDCQRESVSFFFESFVNIISSQLIKQKDVKIVNFGIFKIKNKKARIGRNPKTKEERLRQTGF